MKTGSNSALISNAVMLVFVVAFVVAFATVFGDQNAIVGVGVVVIALMLLGKDLSADPLRNGLGLVIGMVSLGVAAFLATLGPGIALVVDFVVVFVTCFLLVSDLERPLYFPFLLTYIFMEFVAPVTMDTVDQLPMRLMALAVGALIAMAMQVAFNRTRATKIVTSQFAAVAGDIQRAARARREGETLDVTQGVGDRVAAMSEALWSRRVQGFRLSLGARATTDAAVSLQRVAELLSHLDDADVASLGTTDFLTALDEAFGVLARVDEASDAVSGFERVAGALVESLRSSNGLTMRAALLLLEIESVSGSLASAVQSVDHPEDPAVDEREVAGFGLVDMIRAEMKPGTLRFTFAMRMAVLLAAVPFATSLLQPYVPAFEYGRWAAFTLLSVTQPISDLTAQRARDRLLGTLAGSAGFFVIFSFVEDAASRMLLIMLASYMNAFQTTYARQMPFITFMALGAAAGAETFGLDNLSVYRIAFVLVGVVIGVLASRHLFPYSTATATRQLLVRQLEMSGRIVSEALARLTGRTDRLADSAFSTLVLGTNLVQQQIVGLGPARPDETTARFVLSQRSLASEASRLHRAAVDEADVAELGPLAQRLDAYATAVAQGHADVAEGEAIRDAAAATFVGDARRPLGASLASVAQSLLDAVTAGVPRLASQRGR